jgi:hypothetical protein
MIYLVAVEAESNHVMVIHVDDNGVERSRRHGQQIW